MRIQKPVDVMPARSWGRPRNPEESKYAVLARALKENPTKALPVKCRSAAEMKALRVALWRFPVRFGIKVRTVTPGGRNGRTIYLQISEVVTPATALTAVAA